MFVTKTWLPMSVFSAAMSAVAPGASAKCTVTLQFTNNDSHKINILGNDSQSRVNGLTWSKMNFGNVEIEPGATRHASWTTNMSAQCETRPALEPGSTPT